MLMPKKIKYRKWHKRAGNSGRYASRATLLSFGSFGLKAMTEAWVDARQIEAARRVLTRFVRKNGKVWIRVFPDKPVSVKGNIRMGSGKGSPDRYVAPVKPGSILFEIDGIPRSEACTALKRAAYKLPLKAKIVTKTEQ